MLRKNILYGIKNQVSQLGGCHRPPQFPGKGGQALSGGCLTLPAAGPQSHPATLSWAPTPPVLFTFYSFAFRGSPEGCGMLSHRPVLYWRCWV